MADLPVILVSCSSKKRPTRGEAQHLYDASKRFVAARTYAKREGSRWFILSAKHGLLEPTTVIDPYEHALTNEKSSERKRWSEHVAAALGRASIPTRTRVIILAGAAYRKDLTPLLQSMALHVEEPLAKLKMGEQHRWLNEQNAKHAEASAEIHSSSLN